MSNGEIMDADYEVSEPARGQLAVQTKTNYCTAMAVQKPRVLAVSLRKLVEEAALAGEDFYYGWGSGKDKIEGASIDLAMAAVRHYGNCAVKMEEVQETPDAWIFTAVFLDYETGFTYDRQFRQSKNWTVHGKFDQARKEDIRFQIGQSKAQRNCILKCIPKGLINKAMEAAKAGVVAIIEAYVKKNGLAKAVDLQLADFAKRGVSEQQILLKLGLADRKAIDIEQLAILKGDKAAIDAGRERSEDLFPPVAGSATEAAKQVQEKLKTGAKPRANGAKPAPEPQPDEQLALERQNLLDDLYNRLDLAETTQECEALAAEVAARSSLLGEAATDEFHDAATRKRELLTAD